MLGLPTQSGNGDDEEERRRRCDDVGTGRTAGDDGGCFGAVFGVVLGAQNTENNVWKMEDEFFYYLRNKSKNKMS